MRDSEWGIKNDTKLASKYKSLEPLYLDALDRCSWLLGSWLTLREREEASVRVLHSRMGRACIMAWYGLIISSLASLLFCVASNLWRSLHNLMQFRRKKIHMVWMDFPLDFLIRWGIFGVWIWRLIKLLRSFWKSSRFLFTARV